jgi:hypothetical protein
MSDNHIQFSIFYSWQSDLHDSSNRKIIRQSLRNAANSIEELTTDLIIEVDEATRNTSGSPNIPLTILSKIKTADLFVCDVTTVNSSSADIRKMPNPNVVFELGYAVATLGWERIILLFNTKFGEFPDDLPFDFDRHRASPYSADVKPSKNEKENLNSLLKTAIEAVIKSNPSRPTDEKTPEEKKRSRDVENIRWLLSTLHLPALDEYLIECPYKLNERVLYYWESFNGVAGNSLFHLYDSELSKAVKTLHSSFTETVSHGEYYHPTVSGRAYIFSNPGDMPFREDQQKVWDTILAAAQQMRIALDQVLARVRADYLEVDIEATNRAAWQEYVDFKREQAELYEETGD